MAYYSDPSGLGSWWVDEGQDPNASPFSPFAAGTDTSASGTSRNDWLNQVQAGSYPGTVNFGGGAGTPSADTFNPIMAGPDPTQQQYRTQMGDPRPSYSGPNFSSAPTPYSGNSQLGSGWGGGFLGSPSNNQPYGLEHYTDENGNELPPGIGSITLPNPAQISNTFDPDVTGRYMDFMNNLASQIQQQYNYKTPEMQAAEMQLGGIPQPNAQQQQITPELQRMLAGEGYNPATMAQMRSRASEDIAGAGRQEMGQARLAMEQAGLSGSPAGAAVAGDVARRVGNQQTAALRDIDIQNAMEGLTNFRQGVGYQTGIGQSNMQAANAMALENANRLFSGMSQNLQNVQQARGMNTGMENQRLQNMAQATSGTLANQGQAWQQAGLAKALGAEEQNVANQMGTNINNAQLERQRQMSNQGTWMNAWNTAQNLLAGFPSSPGSYGQPGGSFNPLAPTLSNLGSAFATKALSQLG